jgi:hypothetical protein
MEKIFSYWVKGWEYGNATADKVIAPYTIGTENGLVTGTAREVFLSIRISNRYGHSNKHIL